MVAGDRNMEERNGRRSRGPSPNGHLSDDSSASDDSDHGKFNSILPCYKTVHNSVDKTYIFNDLKDIQFNIYTSSVIENN